MRWLVDECVDAALVDLLRQSGHEALYVSEISPRATDIDVMNRAERDHRLLLTEDKDFGDLVFRQARPVPGIVLIRIVAMQRQCKAERLTVAIERFGETLFGRYTVIEQARFRMRPLRSV